MADDLKLISADVCPYAQRTRLVLLEKGIAHESVEIDLRNKPAWFEDVSPYSKVPVLVHGEHTIWESTVINEYLEEAFTEPRLTPAMAAGRAAMRIAIAYDDVTFVPATYKVLLARDEPEKQALYRGVILDGLRMMETRAMANAAGGPWLLGEQLTLADLSIYPHMERLAVLREYRGIELPAECGRLREWLSAMQERESVKATLHDDAYHIAAYAHYADATANGTTAAVMRL
ncbi:MAG: glutathione S-transferase family protein [Rhodospirillaceae bacterium]|jgi:glutathione S-transferase|nr:glutathione S-transferase family protein [Rhodospirillaceae bacterium]MBT6203894.1 glutathione S-transferase family protein [Rhodospirillaceae bacterium]MBT7645591.1 glutathione S-transferase family protein [Rhodospirillaceae bacterium]